MKNEIICTLPFGKIYNPIGLNYSPCCWSSAHSSLNPNTDLPFDHFNSEEMQRLRREMLEGTKTDFVNSYCKVCHKNEKELGYSPRISYLHATENLIKNFNRDGSLKSNIRNPFINVSLNVYGNFCNLECYECMPYNSSSRTSFFDNFLVDLNSKGISKSDFTDYTNLNFFNLKNKEQFQKIIDQILEYSHLIQTIEIVGGEPMLMKNHFILLDKLIENHKCSNIKLSYVSNMTMMELSKMKKYFDSFKSTDILWSVDALKERNYWLRYPTEWNSTTKNVMDVKTYLKKNNKGTIKATITPSLLSVLSLKETYKWLLLHGLIDSKSSIINVIITPSFLRTKNLPNEIKEKISHDLKLISTFHYNDLLEARDQRQFELAIKYFDLLDEKRGTDWRSTFPEVAKYAN